MITVTTKQHIIEDSNYSNCCGCSSLEGDYSNLDANSTIDEVKRFQEWLYSNKEIKLLGGKFDSDTSSNYQKYGNEYETTYNKDFVKTNAEFDSGVNNPVTGVKGGGTFKETVIVTKKNPIGDATKKKKGMSDTAKILIILGIALVLGTTIYFITKEK